MRYSMDSYSNELKNQIQELREEFEEYKKELDGKIDTANFLFETYYLDYKNNNAKSILNYIQLISTELLVFVQNICKEYDIEWWLDYGNLLGAVRHGNYVPWDDDVDIGMMRSDYLKFDKIFAKEIKKYGLDDIVEMGYRPRGWKGETINSFIQIYVRHKIAQSGNRRPILGSVDVFPYDFLVDYDKNTIEDDFITAKHNYFNRKKNHFNLQFCIDEYYEKLNLSFEKTDLIIAGAETGCGPDEIYDLAIFDTNKIFPLAEIEYGDEIFYCPNDVDHYLNIVYGNYLSIPKSLYRHNRQDGYRYNADNDEVFGKCLKRLQEVNEFFE